MKKYFEMCNHIKEIADAQGEIYIRCAGETGQKLCYELQEMGIPVAAFLDRQMDRQSDFVNIPILEPESIRGKKSGTFFVLIGIKDDEIYDQICKEMRSFGLEEGIDYGDFSFDAEHRMMNFEDIRPCKDFYGKFVSLSEERMQDMKALDQNFSTEFPHAYNLISNLDVPVTTYCSLNCTYCSHCIPYANPPKHLSTDKIIEDLDKLLEVSYVACLAIMGGEPLIYPDILNFIKKYAGLKNKKNIGFTRIVTNGTVVPGEEFFKEYSKLENSYIYISNYGEKSRKMNELIDKCNQYSVKVFICPFSDEWLSLGDFRYERNYSIKQLEHLYAVCGSHTCVQLLNGKIYSCGRAPILNEDGLIPYSETDFCDLRHVQPDQLKENLHEYLYNKTYLDACKFCDGQHAFSKKIGRGI